MKKIFFIASLFFQLYAIGQADSLYVNGRFLYNHVNEKLTLKGINYSVLDDWSFPANIATGTESLKEIEKTNANCVRIQWYNNYGNAARPVYALKDLDTLLNRSARFRMIPIVGLWDKTCDNTYTNFANIITAWWTQPATVNLFKKHKRYSIVNLANEFGYYNYVGATAAALTAYKNEYKNAITSLRNAGYVQPIMIDAPDCGTNADAQILTGSEILAHDPLHNIIFSTHAYWISYTGNDSTTISNKIQQMVTSNLPFVFGEIANFQSDATPCQYPLNYTALLNILKQKDIGWLAWNWTFDNCPNRQMSPNGLFANMSAYGLNITNNPVYGLAATAIRNSNTFNNAIVLASNKLTLLANCQQNTLTAKFDLADGKNILIQASDDALIWKTVTTSSIGAPVGSLTWQIPFDNARYFYKAIATNLAGQIIQTSLAQCNQKPVNPMVYPIPSTGIVNIANNIEFDLIQIINQFGQVILQQNIKLNFSQDLDVHHLPSGNFMLKFVSTKNGRSYFKKILLAK